VQFRVINVLKGQLGCTLLKNGEVLSAYVTKYSRNESSFRRALLLNLAGGAGIGVSWVYFKLPIWWAFIACALLVTVVAIGRKRGSTTIEQVSA
jgi:hypothetical protein